MIKIPEEINLENYTLILPSVSVGNVGQLCIDLLISTLNLQKIGSLWNSVFLPICGLDPYDKNSSSLCTAADFYLGTYYKIILLQLRSPCVSNSNDFFNELAQFIQTKGIKKAVILTSSYAYEHVNRSEFNLSYITSDDSLLNDEKLLESLPWKKHMKDISTESVEQYIFGGGFANGLFVYFKSMQIPSTVLFRYCSEGDNVSDALILFQGLNKWLNLVKDSTDNSIKYPPSWEFFFGNPPTSDMY